MVGMRVALVGVGRIGAAHAEVLRAHPDVTDLVLTDADPDRAAAVAERVGATAMASVDQAIDGAAALLIAAATPAHAELIRRGVRAGIPVFCEKPVALDLDSTKAVLAEVRRAGTAVQVGFQRRFDQGYLTARKALRAGELGELHRVHLVTADPRPPHPEYIPASGGLFRDCHIHDFDALRWVTGREVAEVYAIGANRGAAFIADAGDVDNAALVARLDDDTLVTVQGSRYNGGGYDVRMELAGSAATMVVGLDERVPLRSAEPGAGLPPGEPWTSFWDRFTAAYAAEVNAFIELAHGRIDNPCPVADALAAQYVAEAADASRRERRPVPVEWVRP